MAKLVIKPIADVVSEDEIRRKTEEYLDEMLRVSKIIGDDLYLIDKPTGKATPSYFSNDCFVKSLIKLRFGTITNMDGIRNLARVGQSMIFTRNGLGSLTQGFTWRSRAG